MARVGNLYGPDFTYLGIPGADLEEPASFTGAGAAILGAPFDGGTSHRSGAKLGPQAIRLGDYNPQDGKRPHMALGVDGLLDTGVVDLGDLEIGSGDTAATLATLRAAV